MWHATSCGLVRRILSSGAVSADDFPGVPGRPRSFEKLDHVPAKPERRADALPRLFADSEFGALKKRQPALAGLHGGAMFAGRGGLAELVAPPLAGRAQTDHVAPAMHFVAGFAHGRATDCDAARRTVDAHDSASLAYRARSGAEELTPQRRADRHAHGYFGRGGRRRGLDVAKLVGVARVLTQATVVLASAATDAFETGSAIGRPEARACAGARTG